MHPNLFNGIILPNVSQLTINYSAIRVSSTDGVTFSFFFVCRQIFGIYDALPEPSLQKMNEIVKQAVHICTFFYFCVGFFGYIAFSQQNFGGDLCFFTVKNSMHSFHVQGSVSLKYFLNLQ